MTKRPHNNLFQFVFGQRDITRDLIKHLIPQLYQKIDARTLAIDNTSYVNEKLDDFYSDIVYSVTTKGKQRIKISLLLEHKSTPPTIPELQLLDYMKGIWDKDTAPTNESTKNKKYLTTVIAIIFYHGKEKWHKKPFHAHFGNVDKELRTFIPNIEYYLINLADYSDEFILNIKAGFLINALLTFKHKNETEYIRKHFARIFINLEEKADEEATRNFIRRISVYFIITTKIKGKEIIELTQQLKPKTKYSVMTGYESLLLEGEKIGIQKGKIEKSIEIAIKLLQTQMDDDIVINISGVDKETLVFLRLNVVNSFKERTTQDMLAKHLLQTFPFLSNETIAKFAHLSSIDIKNLRS